MSKSISNKSILGALTVNDKNVPVISYSDTTPTSPAVGDFWFNTSNGYTYLYYNDGTSSQWVSVSTSGAGAQGIVSATSPLSYNSSTQNISLTTVPVASGGTGATSLTSGSYLKGNGASAIVSQAGIPAGDVTSGVLDVNRVPAGSVIQAQYYFNNTSNYYNTSTLTDVSSSLRLNFTPKLANSKMLIICAMNWLQEGSHRQVVRLLRNGSTVGSDMWFSTSVSGWTSAVMNHMWEDSAAHTAGTQVTYNFTTATSANNMYYNYTFDGQPGSSNYVIFEVKT